MVRGPVVIVISNVNRTLTKVLINNWFSWIETLNKMTIA